MSKYEITIMIPDGDITTLSVDDHGLDMDIWEMVYEQYPDVYMEIESSNVLHVERIE